jgi:hypothetical protein
MKASIGIHFPRLSGQEESKKSSFERPERYYVESV